MQIGTVEEGEEASAIIVGESPNQILNLVLPKGDKGDKGDTGVAGEKGDKGDTYDDTEVKRQVQNIDNKIENLSTIYIGASITAPTIEGTGRIKKLYGKTEEIGEGEKSPDNPYQIKCVADDINLLNYYGEVIEVTATSDDYNITTNYFAKLIKRKKIHNFL